MTGTSKKISWQTSDPTVTVVNRSGEISANGSGQCTITAKTADDRISCKVTVPEYYPENYNVPDFGAYFNVPLVDYTNNGDGNTVICVYSYDAVVSQSDDWLNDYYDILQDYGYEFYMEQDKRDEEGAYHYFFVNEDTNDMVMLSLVFYNSNNTPTDIFVTYLNTTNY